MSHDLLDQYLADNRDNWNDRVPVHVKSKLYDVQRFIDDPKHISSVVSFDVALMGSIAGRTLAHLQCHIGTDTISLARLGADVHGLDFSDRAISAARELSVRSATPAVFVEANVYDAPAALGRTFDWVYTSVGTICWLSELDRWAHAVAGLLQPGGQFYMRDTHPSAFVFEEVGGTLVPTYDYFTPAQRPLSLDTNETYADGDHGQIKHTRHHEWNHSLAAIVTELARVDVWVERIEEHRGIEWPFVPCAVKQGDQWFLPAALREKIPMMFSLWARKGAGTSSRAPNEEETS